MNRRRFFARVAGVAAALVGAGRVTKAASLEEEWTALHRGVMLPPGNYITTGASYDGSKITFAEVARMARRLERARGNRYGVFGRQTGKKTQGDLLNEWIIRRIP